MCDIGVARIWRSVRQANCADAYKGGRRQAARAEAARGQVGTSGPGALRYLFVIASSAQ
jgi:hypothetical protein